MDLLHIRQVIPFMKNALTLNIISAVMFFIAIFFIFKNGLTLSPEFTGGTVIEFSCSENLSLDKIRSAISILDYKTFQVQHFNSSYDFIISLPLRDNQTAIEQSKQVLNALLIINKNIKLHSAESIGPQIEDVLLYEIIAAILFILVGVMIYLISRFGWKFSLAGIIANLHDAFIILGLFAYFHWEFSMSALAGMLAALSYSINESVIIMDRIRENLRKNQEVDLKKIIDNSITQTMSRTIITHGSTQMIVLSILFFGGLSLHYFALALSIGIWIGIYSSIFVTAALIMWINIKK
ncbi:MAG: protein translocase subunit SecF [Bordetella sp.]|nr:MAG: protein translocase subunit SecF [Bordetella sp.]